MRTILLLPKQSHELFGRLCSIKYLIRDLCIPVLFSNPKSKIIRVVHVENLVNILYIIITNNCEFTRLVEFNTVLTMT